jgi:hypothetical protein
VREKVAANPSTPLKTLKQILETFDDRGWRE